MYQKSKRTCCLQLSLLVATALLVCQVSSNSSLADEKLSSDQTKFFETKIRPVLIKNCYGCHSNKTGKVRGGLLVDSKEAIRVGGDSGAAVVPGNLKKSLLLSAMKHEDFEMPPNRKLSDAIIKDFETWIKMGAPDPRVKGKVKVNSKITAADIEKGREFWAFKKPVQKTPKTSDSSWSKSEVDRYVLDKLEEAGLEPAKDADAKTILRRLCFDLIGLPPTPEQLSAFENKWRSNPDEAIDYVVNRLLDSDRFGERWGRHWLDVARYAESTGKELNSTFPNAWRYRDYVIDSFNNDKPYDQFIKEQVAGDIISAKTDKKWSENLIATGFLAIGPKTLGERNPRQFQADLIDEQIDVTTRVILGISVACARCHDHKFDPIPQTDYYAMAGIFKNMATHYGTLDNQQNRRPSNLIELPIKDPNPFDKAVTKKELEKLQEDLKDKQSQLAEANRLRREARRGNSTKKNDPRASFLSIARLSTQVAQIREQIGSYDEDGAPLSFCMGVQPVQKPSNATLFVRGEIDNPAQTVPRGFVKVISKNPPKIKPNSSGRLQLAKWLTSEDNPLTARVMVNRIWLHLFGNGIVDTPENFGATGASPTHPELLDYLAIKFMKSDWSVKSVIREIVTSRIYRTSSKFNQAHFETDPENKFLWRTNPKRLDAEAIRDAMLVSSGKIKYKRPRASVVAQAGHSIVRDTNIVLQKGDSNSGMGRNMRNRPGQQMIQNRFAQAGVRFRGFASLDMANADFRSVYLPVVRDFVPQSLEVFDFAESTMVVGKRESSNSSIQALYMMNNPFVIRQSDAMAGRIAKTTSDKTEQVKMAFKLAFGRDASRSEITRSLKLVREIEASNRVKQPSRPQGTPNRFRGRFQRPTNSNTKPASGLSVLCQSLFASAEFRYLN